MIQDNSNSKKEEEVKIGETAEIYETPDPRSSDTVEGIPYIPGTRGPSESTEEFEDEPREKDLNMILSMLSLGEREFEFNPNANSKEVIETPSQKILRLKLELQDFKEQLNIGSIEIDNNMDVEDTLFAITSAQEKLDLMEQKLATNPEQNRSESSKDLISKLDKAANLLSEETRKQVAQEPPAEVNFNKAPSEIFEIENRIKSLESLLGPESKKPLDHPEFKNFGGNIAKVYEIMKLLADPTHLNHVIKQIKTINAELEHLNSENMRINRKDDLFLNEEMDVQITNKVEQVMDLYDRLEPLVLQAPILIARLKTMGSFHNEALDMNLIISNMEGMVNIANKESNLALEKVKKIQSSLASNLSSINTNSEYISSKLNELSQRIQRLS